MCEALSLMHNTHTHTQILGFLQRMVAMEHQSL